MRRDDLHELHYITPAANVPSILMHGILSHHRVKRLSSVSIASPLIQGLRRNKAIPGGRMLHDYVNLYVNARNPMMSYLSFNKPSDEYDLIVVLQVDTSVIDRAGTVLSSGNAASKYARFFPVSDGLVHIDYDTVFALSWKHEDDQVSEWRHKSAMCAEILVPDRVAPSHILGAYVSCEQALEVLLKLAPEISASLNADLFFR